MNRMVTEDHVRLGQPDDALHDEPAFVRANEVLTLSGSNAKLASAIGTIQPIPLVDTLRWMYQA
jgi:hypothetical protein